ncbi:MAG: prepilin-type N-terminal cleavage/methylation domain-containing protein [Gammaproteobacteria bacterium]|nr:prepilin-type N-terminal cleavage/methylation domain-containing protein [Gammaproteobacteria bacterium]
MSNRLPLRSIESGFSLTEVLVAFSVLAISLSVILSVFSTGLRSAVRGDEYSHATALGEAHLAAMRADRAPAPGIREGEFDARYSWQTEVRVPEWWQSTTDALHPLRPFEVSIQVRWEELGKRRSIEFTTIRLWPKP